MALVEQYFPRRLFCFLLCAAVMSIVMAVNAQAGDDTPDLNFLAYLGSWQESDKEWLIVAEDEVEKGVKDGAQSVMQRKDDDNET